MSYCRWSSDFGECQVYVYADVYGAWTIHVAGRKLKHKVPDHIKAMYRAIDWSNKDATPFMEYYKAEREWRESLPYDEFMANVIEEVGKPAVKKLIKWPKDSEYESLDTIGPEAGETFNLSSPGECADTLVMLKEKGFNVPQYAIDALREEQKEMDDDK